MIAARARSPRGEAGYAMLLVFLMAAMISIALYRELPRVVFERERDKEQLLIDRGEQYKRAIQVFVRKMNRYPATIEELESTNNIRFLRKRYVDPMTGKDKWRLIHVNGGVLTDSIIPPKGAGGNQGAPAANANTFIAEGPGLAGSTDPTQQQQLNPAMRRRASDDRPVVAPDAPDQPAPVVDDSTNPNPNPNPTDTDQSQNPFMPVPVPTPVAATPAQTMPGTPMNRFPFPNQGGFPGQPGAGQTSSGGVYSPPPPGAGPGSGGYPGGGPPGMTPQSPGFPGQNFGQGVGQGTGQGFGQSPGQGFGQGLGQGVGQGSFGQAGGQTPSAFGQPASQPGFGDSTSNGQGNSPNNLGNMLGLNGPRPGGMAGLPGMGGTQVGGGIAGVASEAKNPSIKVYNERKKYNEWEFVYDKTKDRGLAGVMGNGGVPGTPAGQMGSMPPGVGNNPPGNNSAFGSGSSFGGGSSFGSGSTFGQSSSGFGQSTPAQPPQPPPQPPPQ
jgi:hypothetical protein